MDYSNYYFSPTVRSVFEVSFTGILIEAMTDWYLDTFEVCITHGKASKSVTIPNGHDST